MTERTHPVLRALQRWGGALLAPRRTVAALHPDEGQRDGLWLGVLYVVGTSLYPMSKAIATVLSTGSLIALASGVARVLLTPIVVTVLTETLLGGRRSHRGGLALVPLVVVGTIAHILAVSRLPTLTGLWPDIVGALAAGALALWMRPAVPEQRDADSEDA